MRNHVVRWASAAAFAVVAGSALTSPASAFVGLSDKQADEVSEYIKCQTFLLRGDLASFEADPDCGHGPMVVDLRSLASEIGAGGGGSPDSCSPGGGWTPPPYGSARTFTMGGGYGGGDSCYPEKKHDKKDWKHKDKKYDGKHKKDGKKGGKKGGKKHDFPSFPDFSFPR